jgi:hypothetical protein
MIPAKDMVLWINHDTREVMVRPHSWGCPEDRERFRRGFWCDPIGAAYSQWHEMKNPQRGQLMTETAIDLAMQGFSLTDVLRTLAEVPEFRALGRTSYPMCRALTQAIVCRCLEPNTMSFDELLVAYAPERATAE